MFRVVGLVAALIGCCAAHSLTSPDGLGLHEKTAKSQADAFEISIELMGTTTPPPAQTMTGIVETIVNNIGAQLRSNHAQWANALVAAIVGICLLINGESVFKWLVIGAVFLFTMLAALSDVTTIWGLGYGSPLRRIISLLVGAACSWAAYRGINGVMLVVGAILGAIIAWSMHQTIVGMGCSSAQNHVFITIWYSVFLLGFMAVMDRNKHMAALAVLSPFVGGALVSSALFWFLAFLAERGVFHLSGSVSGAWLDFLEHLIKKHNHDVGILAGHRQVLLFGHAFDWDIICGRLVWFLLFGLGVAIQIRRLKQTQEEKAKSKKKKTMTKGATKDLQKPLMKDAV